ncbi:MAG: hypothetical protein KDD43_11365 [Bdellovibrionales bacterium]|nr:hypothetical protein [Bdellovibrionales bacterium]
MNLILKVILGFVISGAALADEQAQVVENRRWLSVDSQYFLVDHTSTVPTNRALGGFAREFVQSHGALFDLVGSAISAEKSAWIRLPYYLVFGGAFFIFVQEPLNLAYHEFGHASRLQALGATPVFLYEGSSQRYSNMFSYYLDGIGKAEQGGQVVPGTTTFTLSNPEYTILGPFGELNNPIYLMGGLNNEMFLAENLENNLYFEGGHLMEAALYVRTKLGAFFYVEDSPNMGDVVSIESYYKGRTFDISSDDISQASEMAFLLSSTTYAYLYSLYNYTKSNDATVRAWTYEGFQIPNLQFYMTRRGLSYKINSAYELSEAKTWIRFAIEQVSEGQDASEITIGYRRVTSLANRALIGEVDLMMGAGGSATAQLRWEADQGFWLNLGGSYYTVSSLWGERHIPLLNNGDSMTDIWAGVSLTY